MPILYVDLPNTAWDAQREWTPGTNSLFANVEVMALPAGGSRLRIEGQENISVFYNALLPPDQGKGHRLCIDFMPVAD